MLINTKISIIIPVYNVEAYLAECLESAVNQTIQEIQIICVNDGSTDHSRVIIQEYADRDSRIEIIDKPNGGLSSARNAAYPYIKGKYTLFVDSDDWIEFDLCEKVYSKAESTGVPITIFFYFDEDGPNGSDYYYGRISAEDKKTVEEKLSISDYHSAWSKLWRTDFLLINKLYFPEGLIFEDALVHWKAITLAETISIFPQRLYHYRFRPGSIMMRRGQYGLHYIRIYQLIYEYLLESGYYPAYRQAFIMRKLEVCCFVYQSLPHASRSEYKKTLQHSLTQNERDFFRSASENPLSKKERLFYEMIDGGWVCTIKYHFFLINDFLIRLPRRFFRRVIIKPLNILLKITK